MKDLLKRQNGFIKLENNKLEFKALREYKTRNCLKATILKTNARGIFPIIGIVHTENEDKVCSWQENGMCSPMTSVIYDLIDYWVKPKEFTLLVERKDFENNYTTTVGRKLDCYPLSDRNEWVRCRLIIDEETEEELEWYHKEMERISEEVKLKE